MEHTAPKPPMRIALRVGIAIFNAGAYHAAHDAWEERWLDLNEGTPDEQFLHGLIQYTAAVHHADAGNRVGATGLAASARRYLAGLSTRYRGVALIPIRHWLAAIELDPSSVNRHPVDPIIHEGVAIRLADLGWEDVCFTVRVLAEENDRWDRSILERAVDRGETIERFQALLVDFVQQPDRRDLIYDRLVSHLERESAKDDDVEGLFEEDTPN